MTTTPQATQLRLLAATPPGGFALQNGTPSILSYTFPNDGFNHRFIIICSIVVSTLETGGAVTQTYTAPGGTPSVPQITGGGSAVGTVQANYRAGISGSGTAVTIQQSSALTAGAAVLYAEIWGA